MLARRSLLAQIIGGTALLGGATLLGLPVFGPGRLAFAAGPNERRLLVLLNRGAMDGLGAVPAHGDPAYRSARGAMAQGPVGRGEGGILDLDGHFGLHPALAPIHPWWKTGELAAVHAVALPCRTRSHFDAQDALEGGAATPHGAPDGWLNRALGALKPGGGTPTAVGPSLPLLLQGAAAATSVDLAHDSDLPDELLDIVATLYAADPLLGPALREGRQSAPMMEGDDMPEMGRRRRGGYSLGAVATAAGTLLSRADGPRVAVLETGGWDTHSGQGTTTGRLSRQLGGLGNGLVSLKAAMGATWTETVVIVVSEFGRTVAGNGTGGTDHGTGGVVLLCGGAVAGGKVYGKWPGLAPAQQFEGRDLMPTTDLRAVWKGVLRDHMGMDDGVLAERVFPDSKGIAAMEGLIRRS